MTRVIDLHKEWMEDPQYQHAYAALEQEFNLADAMMKARVKAGLGKPCRLPRKSQREPFGSLGQ